MITTSLLYPSLKIPYVYSYNFTRLQPWKELITTWGHSPVKAMCRAGALELAARARSEQQLSLRLTQLPSSKLFVV